MDFVFKRDVIDFFKRPDVVNYEAEIDFLKGFSCPKLSTTVINLSAMQWVVFYHTAENLLISELCKTIIHENIHDLVGTTTYEGIDYTPVGEERVADILSGQIPEDNIFTRGTRCVTT